MAEVQVQRRSLVLPAKPTQRESLYLSCLDICWQDFHYNERLIFYQCPGVSGQQDGMLSGQQTGAAPLMQKLQSSLALCLVEYYPWCGRIAKSADPPHRLFIDCSDADAGVEFVEASVPIPLSLLAHNGFQMNPFFEQLCQHPDHRGDSLFSSPLLSIQATLFSDGGLALGIAQSHIVADGQSLWNFLVSWGECARGMPLTVVPLHTREKLALPNPPPMPADSNFHFEVQDADICDSYDELADNANTSVSMNKCLLANDGNIDGEEQCTTLCKEMGSHPHGDSSGISGINPHITIIPMSDMGMNMLPLEADSLVSGADLLVQCVVTVSDLAIRKLKHEAHGAYTSYEVMCAHFWQRVTIARGGPQNEPTFFAVFANSRSRMSPPLPPAYFGNVIMFAVASDTVGKLSSESLSSIADRIHNAKATCDENSLMGFMHWLELNDNHMAFAINPAGQMVFMASSPRFPAYQVDFGWGRPDAVRSVKVHGDGELVIFGGQSGLGHGGVEICLALPANVMKRLLEDRQFLAQLPKGTSKMSTTIDKISTS